MKGDSERATEQPENICLKVDEARSAPREDFAKDRWIYMYFGCERANGATKKKHV